MLRYLNEGVRNQNSTWAQESFEPQVRGNWEFMAVIQGSAKPVFANGTSPRFLEKRLLIMPPMSKHTWCTRKNEKCKVIVMHFASLPTVVERYISKGKPISIPLSPTDIESIRKIYNEVLPHYNQPHLNCIVWFEKALTDLCLLVIRKLRRSNPLPDQDSNNIKIQQALDWYRANLVNSPKLEDLCKAIDVSMAQLLKMFKAHLNDSPSQVFRWLALNEACTLMSINTLSLKEIAFQCGFDNSAQFYGAFQRHFHVSPSEWRDNRFYGKLGFNGASRIRKSAD